MNELLETAQAVEATLQRLDEEFGIKWSELTEDAKKEIFELEATVTRLRDEFGISVS